MAAPYWQAAIIFFPPFLANVECLFHQNVTCIVGSTHPLSSRGLRPDSEENETNISFET